MEQTYNTEQPPGSSCPLLSLPTEVRLRIYDYVYGRDKSILHNAFSILSDTDIQVAYAPATMGNAALLRTCRQINSEATPYLYQARKFTFSIFGQRRQPESRGKIYLAPIQGCPTLSRVQRLSFVLHVYRKDCMDCIFHRLGSALQSFDGQKPFQECSVSLIISRPTRWYDAQVALTAVQRILDLEWSDLNPIQRQVYTLLWKETIRVGRRTDDGCDTRQRLEAFLEENGLSAEKEIGKLVVSE